MEFGKSKLGIFGIGIGAVALLLALINFWAGPFSPQPTFETTVAEKAASIRQATIDAFKGKEVKRFYVKPGCDTDKIIDVVIPVISVLAILLGLFSFITKEPIRIAGGAAALGISAIAFQFIAMYAMALLVVLLICAVLGSLGAS